MKKAFVFCIGGTGLRVMKSIVHLMAAGYDAAGYEIVPIIVDPHQELDEKKELETLIADYCHVQTVSQCGGADNLGPLHGFFQTSITSLDQLLQRQEPAYSVCSTTQTFAQYTGEAAIPHDTPAEMLIHTLFSAKNRNSSLDVGFKGNPNVGTVVLDDMVENAAWLRDFMSQCADGDRVFIIASIFGGTGAAGYPLIEKKIRHAGSQAVKSVVMGALAVLPYYALTDPEQSGSDIQSTAFYTKTKAALAYYAKTAGTSRGADYTYYIGESKLQAAYDNNEAQQRDSANFVELIAATALFHFLHREGRPDTPQYLSRAIEHDEESLTLTQLGDAYRPVVKAVADIMLLHRIAETLKHEKHFPLTKKNKRNLNKEFYDDNAFKALNIFIDKTKVWYDELRQNKRAFAVLNTERGIASDWIKGTSLAARDDSYYLLQMIRESNADVKTKHLCPMRYFLDYSYKAITHYTSKICQQQ